jgi:hypothetical protein
MAQIYNLLTVGNAVVALSNVEKISAYDDVVHSCLLAQLVANKKIESVKVESWYGTYVAVLDDFWIRNLKFRQDFSLNGLNASSALEWASAAMANSGSEDHALGRFLAYAAQLPCYVPAIQIWPGQRCEEEMQEPCSPLKVVRLLAIVGQSPTSISSIYLEFKTRQELARNPWSQRFEVDEVEGQVCVRYARANLSETLYALSRQAIARKLGDRLADNVALLVEKADLGL